MSKRGKDYDGGGFYFLDKKIKIIMSKILLMLVILGSAMLQWPMEWPVNLNKEPDFDNKNDGRWFLGLYSNQSDEVKDRHTGSAIKD